MSVFVTSLGRRFAMGMAGLTLVYGCVVVFMLVFQSRLIYVPQIGRAPGVTPASVGLAFEDVWLEISTQVRLHGWYVPHRQAHGTVLFFHGNAGSIGLRLEWLRMFSDLGYAVFIVDYRGYGRSSGDPSEHGTYEDASAAWEHLVAARGVAPQDIVIVGESLGGAVAVDLAARRQARALVIQSTFTSVPDLAAQIYPWLPARWISRFTYDSAAKIGRVGAPVLIAHSPHDELIGFDHARALHAHARGPKTLLLLAGGHNEGALHARTAWVEELARFLRRWEAGAGT